MEKALIIYGSSTGNTEKIAQVLAQELKTRFDVTLLDVTDAEPRDMTTNDVLLLGSSTWYDGQLQEDFQEFYDSMDEVDLKGKRARINTSGAELSGNLFPEKIWNKPVFITKLGINYAYCELTNETNEVFSYYVLDNLKNKLDIEVSHKIWSHLKGSWRISYQDRNGRRTATETYEPFWLVNTRLMWKTPSTELYVLASNLFDTEYYDLGTIAQPGRWISFGISHQIKFK